MAFIIKLLEIKLLLQIKQKCYEHLERVGEAQWAMIPKLGIFLVFLLKTNTFSP